MTIDISALPILEAGSVAAVHLADGAVTTPKIAAAAVTAAKLAQSAVELTAATVTGQLPEARLTDNSVGLSKVKAMVRQVPLERNTNEVSAVGVAETEVKTLTFSKKGNSKWVTMAIVAALKATSGTAYLKVYFDAEPTARATLSAASTSYDLQESADINISDLSNGEHAVHFKLYASAAGITAFNKLVELYAIKDTV